MKLQSTMCALLVGLSAAIAGCESDRDEAEVAPKAIEGPATGDEPVVGYALIEVREIDIPGSEADVAAAAAGTQAKADTQPQAGASAKATDTTVDRSRSGDESSGDRNLAGGVQSVGADTLEPGTAAMDDATFQSAKKIKGDKRIPLGTETTQVMDATDMEGFNMRARICIDERGTPTSVTVVDPAPYEDHNEKVQQAMMGWRYQPATVGDEPVPSCKQIELAYRIEDVGKTRPILYDPQAPHGENRPDSQGIHQP